MKHLLIKIKTIINWRIFCILLVLSFLSVLAILPYVLTLQGDLLKQLDIPISTLIIIQVAQSTVLFAVVIFFGLLLSKKTGLRLPVLEAVVAGREFRKPLKDFSLLSPVLGLATAITIFTLDKFFTAQGSGISTSQELAPIWQKLLASFYGGVSEEILLRLFLMSLFIWIGMKSLRKTQPSQIIIITSILFAAVIFGLGHLPITAAVTAITPIVLARAIILNGIAGVVFGWLFWKKGLEAAILSHFTADIFLLTILPLIF